MNTAFFEQRISAARGTDSMAADVMRHINARQHLGKAVIICESPIAILGPCRKQWLKICRRIQKQRASTLNADKILKYTHSIARMQHARFTLKKPTDYPEGDIFLMKGPDIPKLPYNCFSIYILTEISTATAKEITRNLPPNALVIDYVHATDWPTYDLEPKHILEKRVTEKWKDVRTFLDRYQIVPEKLRNGNEDNLEAMDDALDLLLDVSQHFLEKATAFQRSLELARPLKTTTPDRLSYDTVVLLAHRVQALGTDTYTQRFLQSYNEDDSFYFYDFAKEHFLLETETLEDAVKRHIEAGRNRLAVALEQSTFLNTK